MASENYLKYICMFPLTNQKSAVSAQVFCRWGSPTPLWSRLPPCSSHPLKLVILTKCCTLVQSFLSLSFCPQIPLPPQPWLPHTAGPLLRPARAMSQAQKTKRSLSNCGSQMPRLWLWDSPSQVGSCRNPFQLSLAAHSLFKCDSP